ncbi:dTDP-4-dehydrorhamnose reductase [Pinirhizobacter soli]|uniref:dTDP-4-dehydrorhamnose reductase n=1 Tax=Pinirhizobacter soli TaxID=2786953 RepID=UPI002029FFF3|nr:dTDP-4-dehydrorhamnose reductase [Pinirhizobacter soli]
MKILVLGAGGQLGRQLCAELADLGEVTAATREGRPVDGAPDACLATADLAAPDSVLDLLDQMRPDIIANAAAYTAVDAAESDEAVAWAINAQAVGDIAAWAARHGSLVLHYSTDYVFDGNAREPYPEDAPTSPAGAYGRSKLEGEVLLASSGAHYLLFRTAWVYAPWGKNFLLTMLRLAGERDELRVVADQIGAPTSVALIAQATRVAIAAWLAALPRERQVLEGTYHVVASGQTSWHGFAQAIVDAAASAGQLARHPVVMPITTLDFPTPARRPAYSVLDNRKFQHAFGFPLPDWTVGLTQVMDELCETKHI